MRRGGWSGDGLSYDLTKSRPSEWTPVVCHSSAADLMALFSAAMKRITQIASLMIQAERTSFDLRSTELPILSGGGVTCAERCHGLAV